MGKILNHVKVLIAGICAVLAQSVAAEWDILDYNPVPSDADVILPMPCGGKMVFVPIVTGTIGSQSDRLYGDTVLWLGWGGARETAFQEAEWREYVSGGLTDDANRYYLIAKYELTADQYTAVMDQPCDADGSNSALPSLDAGLPVTRVTWFDAVMFSDAYTLWLLENHADLLPPTFGGRPFVRLPTEAEWEYAARGADRVTDTELRNERFPMDGTISDYGWYAGSASSRGELQFIGNRQPNPAGLFDVYGNVGELVLEGFRANKAGRLHGQLGAATIKGGTFLSAPDALRSGARLEMPHYALETGAPVRRRDVGFRPVMTGLVTGDLEHAQAMSDTWDSLGEVSDEDGSVLDRLRTIADNTSDLALRSALNDAATTIGTEIREREEREREALENLVMSGSIMAMRLHDLHFRIERMRNLFGAHEVSGLTNPTREEREAEQLYFDSMREFGMFAEVYADAFLRVTDSYGSERIVEIARSQGQQHGDRGLGLLRDGTFAFGIQVRDYDSGSGWDREQVIIDLMRTLRLDPTAPEWFDEALRN